MQFVCLYKYKLSQKKNASSLAIIFFTEIHLTMLSFFPPILDCHDKVLRINNPYRLAPVRK